MIALEGVEREGQRIEGLGTRERKREGCSERGRENICTPPATLKKWV
jgi:hypothetical protein